MVTIIQLFLLQNSRNLHVMCIIYQYDKYEKFLTKITQKIIDTIKRLDKRKIA